MHLHSKNICDNKKNCFTCAKIAVQGCSVAAATQSHLQTGTWLIRTPVWAENPNEICTYTTIFRDAAQARYEDIIYKNK